MMIGTEKKISVGDILSNTNNPGLRVPESARGGPELQQAREREESQNIITAANPGLRVLQGVFLHLTVSSMQWRFAAQSPEKTGTLNTGCGSERELVEEEQP